ncbi:pyruvate dehydrogenase (acetyl-transferring) E1 component subunit alpha [Paracoccus sp. PS-1]|uniref:pyruvate dehydrogenase (acetyl-transferring) E1 component subunit alpha n=1 Tax=unclassified Paracoccus (in: a-proteobacteria) TaxID=2688777 RepID=UPI00048E11C5|nr:MULTISPECIES: pyruvate dehydrogenase (acetyl-transferring) E1 component subunit alpha [unclassified Paracoccus (in: a-proteobacteria)]MDQ7261478.1 pyruvate dehydrogenase (acetyl-transferring) E1 component subunit alpha [Paracoccus sp. PS1]UFM64303.1 pyruvate dehydrogenase (acetyl-transferring) E1 component subunit alpha [Paracoccus sp. MA]
MVRKPAARQNTSNVSKDELLKYYRDMLLIRRFEEKAGQLYGMGLIGGFCHLYIGQEAVVVGLEAAAKEGDKRITSYRDHGHMLACGMEARGVMAELTGRIGGYSKGKGGSMHMFSREKHFYGGHGIVAAQVPLGAGLAFADKYLGNDNVTFVYFGDGASNQGQVYETYNMAELWELPVVFVIENNQYAMGTSMKRSTKSTTLFGRGESFGIKGEQVDGMDVLAVKAAGEKAVAHCRAGKGPYILEVMTYRYRGHSMSDPAKYRTREEVQKMRDERDAIEHVRELLLTGKHASEEDLKAIDKEIKDIVNDSAEFAKESPEPPLEELWTDIYAKEVPQGGAEQNA